MTEILKKKLRFGQKLTKCNRDAPEPGNLPEPVPWLRSRSWHTKTPYNITIKKLLEIFDIKSLKTLLFFFSKKLHTVMFEACGAFRPIYVKKFEVITKKYFIIFFNLIFFPK